MPDIVRQVLTSGLGYTGTASPTGSLIQLAGDDLLLVIEWDGFAGTYFNLYSVGSGGAATWIASAQNTDVITVVEETRSEDGRRWLLNGYLSDNSRRFIFVELDETSLNLTGFADVAEDDSGFDDRPLFLHSGSDLDSLGTDTQTVVADVVIIPAKYLRVTGNAGGVSDAFFANVADLVVGHPSETYYQALNRGGSNIDDDNAFVLLEHAYWNDPSSSDTVVQADAYIVDSSYVFTGGVTLATDTSSTYAAGNVFPLGGGVLVSVIGGIRSFATLSGIVTFTPTDTLGYHTTHGSVAGVNLDIVSFSPIEIYALYQEYDMTTAGTLGPVYVAAITDLDPAGLPPLSAYVMRGGQIIGFSSDGTNGRIDVWGAGGGWYLGSVTF